MEFKREAASPELIDQLSPLLEKHYREIAHYPDIELVPDYEAYLRMESAGVLRVYTARDDKGELLGYSIFTVRHNIHYAKSLQAVQDILYIDKERRGFGAKFILWCDKQLQAEGVQAVYHHVKEKHNFGPLLKRMGYELVDLIYARRLD